MFEAVRGEDWSSDIALDNVVLDIGRCSNGLYLHVHQAITHEYTVCYLSSHSNGHLHTKLVTMSLLCRFIGDKMHYN